MNAYDKERNETIFFNGISNYIKSIYLVNPLAIINAQLSELHSN